MSTTKRHSITGQDAIDYAYTHGTPLRCYDHENNSCDSIDNIDKEYAAELCDDDPSLVYVHNDDRVDAFLSMSDALTWTHNCGMDNDAVTEDRRREFAFELCQKAIFTSELDHNADELYKAMLATL